MRKVLYILGNLNDHDMDWIARTGRLHMAPDGEVLIQQGVASDDILILLEGHMSVDVQGLGTVATLGAGEIAGEMSFVDSALPSATVRASGDAKVLKIDKEDMREELAQNIGFAGRFYNALALFLADRLRATQTRQALSQGDGLAAEDLLEDELDMELMDQVSQAGESFNRLLRRLLN